MSPVLLALISWLKVIYAASPTLLPIILDLLNALSNIANSSVAKDTSGKLSVKMSAMPLSAAEIEVGGELSALAANSGFDGHRIAQLLRFAVNHPMLFSGMLRAIGLNVPPEIMDLIKEFLNGSPAAAVSSDGTEPALS